MKRFIRRVLLAVLPTKLRNRWHFRLAPEEYVILPRAVLNYAEDNIFTMNSPTFLQDTTFLRAYQLGEQTNSWHGGVIRWRAYIACWAGQYAMRLPGDFVECGVNRGGLARTIIDYVQFQDVNKQFYLIDNFTGLVPEYLNEAERGKQLLETYAYYEDNTKAAVVQTFEKFSNVRIIQGNVPDVLGQVSVQAVAFLSLDMNCTMPEITAAEHFWDRLVPGGIILLDDYAQAIHSEQQLAFDAFAKQRGLGVLSLPTGQGIIIKPPTFA